MRATLIVTLFLLPTSARAATLSGDPSSYASLLGQLQPGDTLQLAAGTYPNGLNVTGLNGSAGQPITIEGPQTGAPAVFTGRSCCNTVEITNSSYVVIRNLKLDGKNLAGVFGVSAKDGLSNLTHHITVEGLTIVNHGASQQTVGISTKTPTWGWVIRRNTILQAGTGLYLGNSNGQDPFFDGVIEHNLVADCVGYDMQIKHQLSRPDRPGMPKGKPLRTIIRHNVFIKNDAPSPDGDRPNLLVDGFPSTGEGAQDLYEIYGNLLFHNPRESLLQAAGRVAIHDNLFVDVAGNAMRLGDHNLPLKLAHVYNNTICAAGKGVHLASAPDDELQIRGNLIFADTPLSGSVTGEQDNLELQISDAPGYVTAPSTTLGSLDLYPLPGKVTGSPIDLGPFVAQTDYDRDFNGSSKGSFTFRGAYAGEGSNPGWKPAAAIKTLVAPTPDGGPGPTDGGSVLDAADSDGSAGADGAPTDGGATTDGSPAGERAEEGCGCRLAGRPGGGVPLLLLSVFALAAGGRRRRRDPMR